MRRIADFGGAGAFQPRQVTRGFNHRHVQAVADAEERNFSFTGETHRADLAFGTALAEAAGHQYAVDIFEEAGGVVALEHFAVDPVQMDFHIIGQAAMGQRLGQRLVAVLDLHVLADHGDAHFAFRVLHPLDHFGPARQVGFGGILDAEHFQELRVEADIVIGERHAIDGVQVHGGNDALGGQVAEQADLAAIIVGNGMGGAAQQNVGLDADGPQLFHAVLGRLGLELARRFDERHQRQVDEGGLAAPQIIVQLADGFEERQAFDVPHRAADFHQQEVQPVYVGQHEFLDHVGDVRDHLHGAAQIAALALLLDHLGIDAPGGDVVGLARRHAGEAFIVPQVQIGLGTVVGDIDFAVLERAHRARIHIQIRVEFAQTYFVTARL